MANIPWDLSKLRSEVMLSCFFSFIVASTGPNDMGTYVVDMGTYVFEVGTHVISMGAPMIDIDTLLCC